MARNYYQTAQRESVERFCERVNEIMDNAAEYHYSHRDILSLLSGRVYDAIGYADLSRYHKNYISGVIDTRLSLIERHEIEWRPYHPELGHVEKIYFSALTGKWHECIPDKGAFFWKDTSIKYSGNEKESNNNG